MEQSRGPEQWLRQYLDFYLSKIDPSVSLRRLSAAGKPLALFGEMPIPANEFGMYDRFTKEWAKFSEADQRAMEEVYPVMAQDLFETTVEKAVARARSSGRTEAAVEHELEQQGRTKERQALEKEVRELRRRFRVMNSKILHGLLFTALLVGSLSLALWFAGSLGPQTTQITIEYNVGEIIAGVLGGAGAAAAGLGYAAKSLRKPDDNEKTTE